MVSPVLGLWKYSMYRKSSVEDGALPSIMNIQVSQPTKQLDHDAVGRRLRKLKLPHGFLPPFGMGPT
jgi:hypothetical protein